MASRVKCLDCHTILPRSVLMKERFVCPNCREVFVRDEEYEKTIKWIPYTFYAVFFICLVLSDYIPWYFVLTSFVAPFIYVYIFAPYHTRLQRLHPKDTAEDLTPEDGAVIGSDENTNDDTNNTTARKWWQRPTVWLSAFAVFVLFLPPVVFWCILCIGLADRPDLIDGEAYWNHIFSKSVQCFALFLLSFICLIFSLKGRRIVIGLLIGLYLLTCIVFVYDVSNKRYQFRINISTPQYWDNGGPSELYITWWWYNNRRWYKPFSSFGRDIDKYPLQLRE